MFSFTDYWDTTAEKGVDRLCARPKKIGAMFPASTIFPFNAVLRQPVNYPPELFGWCVYNVFTPNTIFGGTGVEAEKAFRGTPVLRREMLCAIPPSLFGEEICCLAGFLGETGDSGYNPCFERRAKRREI